MCHINHVLIASIKNCTILVRITSYLRLDQNISAINGVLPYHRCSFILDDKAVSTTKMLIF